jgi:hypothetical protein
MGLNMPTGQTAQMYKRGLQLRGTLTGSTAVTMPLTVAADKIWLLLTNN